ncbi:unnamed protein product [Clonostachys rhizophaga]|uniref:Uncharacterized protein n=1 Tax=Clonostachys rhizophaga TaxID=160324 RepID=A0A9N9YPG0_9HYPO|nr:unnamed protein product [Clonostachys rhizophaga]
MADELAGKNLVGAVAIGKGAAEKCMEVLVKCKAERKHVAIATFPVPDQEPRFLPVFQIMASFITWTEAVDTLRRGVSAKKLVVTL